jgi:hypothetical protein
VSLANRIDALAVRLPETDPRKAEFRRRIATLADECGCTMGGAFFVAAAALTLGYFVVKGGVDAGSALGGAVFVFAAALMGKAIGLGMARVRLLWLGRVLAVRLASVEAG